MAHSGVEKMARAILAKDGRTIRRPVHPQGEDHFDVAYVRAGPRTQQPVVVIPGGPGLASVAPYRSFRQLATLRGLDVIMVEHRGIGLSGRTDDGAPLDPGAVTIEQAADDIAAVLDDADASTAVIAGSSYGSYLAQAFAIRHPGRVAALILDSPMLSVESDLAAVRAHRRSLFWDGEAPRTARIAPMVRALADRGEQMRDLDHVVQVVHEFAGPDILERLLRARLNERLGWLWSQIVGLGAGEVEGAGVPFFMEPDAVASMAYQQLGYGLPPDGGPLDPQLTFQAMASTRPPYTGEPFDLPQEVPGYAWPTVVISGDRDLRTPRPVAQRIVELAPRGVLLPLAGTGHSALDTHQLALLHTIRVTLDGQSDRVPTLAARLAGMPRKGASGHLGRILTLAVRATTRP